MNKYSWFFFVGLLLVAYPIFANTNENAYDNIQQNRVKVDLLFATNPEALQENETLNVANTVIKNRLSYSGDTIAKVFLLLANVAMNKSDFTQAFQFATDGLSVPPIDISVKLQLQLIITKGFYSQGLFNDVLNETNNAINLANNTKKTEPLLLFLAYRSMAHALLEKHQKAFADLREIAEKIKTNKHFSENIALLEILAVAYYYLNDYSMVVELYQKILKLRFELNLPFNLVQNYFNLARAYHKLGLLDDAYNAYWEASQYAHKNDAAVPLAYAALGLGDILYLQQDFQGSLLSLIEAEQLFKGKGIPKAYLNTIISLAKTNMALNHKKEAFLWLKQAETLSIDMHITHTQIDLFSLLANKYQSEGDLHKANNYLNKYIELSQQENRSQQEKNRLRKKYNAEREKSKLLVRKLSKESELSSVYTAKFRFQQQLIAAHVVVIFILIIVVIMAWFKRRPAHLTRSDEELDKPLYFIESSANTKKLYQRAYKQARKYNYPLSVGCLSIQNWNELSFHFNKKVLAEVSKTVATLINEHLDEFDQAGLMNKNEYLLLFPHQTCREVSKKITYLKEALNVRFFANLGEFSVTINVVCQTPAIQDIDPYMFLARLSEAASIVPFEVKKS